MPSKLPVDHIDVQSSTYCTECGAALGEACKTRGLGREKTRGAAFHSKRLRKYRGVLASRRTAIQRFWIKTKKVGDCLVWTAAVNPGGYGIFRARDKNGDHQMHIAPRWILEQVVGKLDPELDAMHSCDNPSCVALQHLSPGSSAANVADCIVKGRQATGNAMPHAKLDPERVRLIRRLHVEGLSLPEIKARLNGLVSIECINRVIHRRSWKHVT